MTYCGIDPGKTGAVAFISGNELTTVPLPYDGNRLDPLGLLAILREHKPDCVFVEEQQYSPVNGRSNATTFLNYGQIIAVCLIYGVSTEFVPAAKWTISTKAADKKAPRLIKAKALWPSNDFKKDDDGHVDAALLARYGQLRERQ